MSDTETVEEWARLIEELRGPYRKKHARIGAILRALAAERDALAAQLAAAVPPGHVIVPRVATQEMVMAAFDEDGFQLPSIQSTWTAMVEAAGKKP